MKQCSRDEGIDGYGESGKSQDLHSESANWRLRIANDCVPDGVQKPENQGEATEQLWSRGSKLKTQEKMMFEFELEGRRKSQCSTLEVIRLEDSPYLGKKITLFCYIQTFK